MDMNEREKIISYAEKTFVAMKNPYGSVEKVFPLALENFISSDDVRYVGIKNVTQIPQNLVTTLQTKGMYHLHTLDKCSDGGRAIDVHIVNPISGRCMTGSSSGTAVNVLLGINDLGIGTDGGGSILAPAASVNLFGFISKLICEEHLKQFEKKSTDGILFTPSIGFITRSFCEMKHAVKCCIDLQTKNNPNVPTIKIFSEKENFNAASADRKTLIDFLNNTLPECDVLVSREGPIDAQGFGDTIFGHFDDYTKKEQDKSNKGFMRVANMVGATALVIPQKEFATTIVLLCESKIEKISTLFNVAKDYITDENLLVKNYFTDAKNFFPREYFFGG